MSRHRIRTILLLAVVSFAAGISFSWLNPLGFALADGGPPPPPPPPSSGGGSSPPPVSTPSPTPAPTKHPQKKKQNLPPGMVSNLRVDNTRAKGLLISWQLPPANDIAKVYVRRTLGTPCASGPYDGAPVGTTTPRSAQWDTAAQLGVHYCYSVFVVDTGGKVSPTNSTGLVALPDHTPPAPVTNVTARASGGQVVVAWPAAKGADHYIVMRGPSGSCPTTVNAGAALGKPAGTSLTDSTAKPGAAYCYSVFSADKAGNVQHQAATSNSVSLPKPQPVAATTGAAPKTTPDPPASNQSFAAKASRMIAAVGAATLVFGLILLIGIRLQGSSGRRRVESFYYPRQRSTVARVALDRYDPRALVIPAMLAVGLIILAAAAALAL
jgi:hypothetical protein